MTAGRRIRNRRDLDALSAREKRARARALEALAEARRIGLPLSVTAREAGTTVRTVVRYAGPAVDRLPSGRYRVRPWDRLYRRIQVISTGGPVWQDTWSSRKAGLAADHANAVRFYGLFGDDAVFEPFRGRTVRGAELETDPEVLAGFAAAGEFDEFELYEAVA